jgi:hypothetical protein
VDAGAEPTKGGSSERDGVGLAFDAGLDSRDVRESQNPAIPAKRKSPKAIVRGRDWRIREFIVGFRRTTGPGHARLGEKARVQILEII